MASILVVEDDLTFSRILHEFLKKNGYGVTVRHSFKDGTEALSTTSFDLALFDYRLPDGNGLDLLEQARQNTRMPAIMMTSFNDVRTAVKAIQWGATDYILKPVYPEELLVTIHKALGEKPKDQTSESNFIEGESEGAKKLFEHVRLIAPTDMSVVIGGESGTGKEFVARTIHQLSKRKNGPFVAVDCGVLSADLAASELFGHIKGSFTGAVADRAGNFEAASKGTLFLDEIGNLSYDIQVKLLRAIQEKTIRRLGGNTDINVDVRIIVASNENLLNRTKAGTFREDLYHRLNEFGLSVPALRERGNDLTLFASLFREMANRELTRNVKGFSREVMEVFRQYPWPGNLRELKNVVRRAVLFTKGDTIDLSSIPVEMTEPQPMVKEDHIGNVQDLKSIQESTERTLIAKTLVDTGYNKAKTARLLNIDRKTLYLKMEKYNIK
ncbi:MAG TPA: sigma-54 dependent transcriptional regulator [Cyclobacteriaceae bacterium]|nr:sigma-54 dependent transcriptional regulator [Cyclobacteriaceae bacterium]